MPGWKNQNYDCLFGGFYLSQLYIVPGFYLNQLSVLPCVSFGDSGHWHVRRVRAGGRAGAGGRKGYESMRLTSGIQRPLQRRPLTIGPGNTGDSNLPSSPAPIMANKGRAL
ncbi:hypothetical protein BaRGS_00037865 [Batillaria attramentaria]|uniref:Uncharacterized protein n=1 Tax=Batillaria attramentaria TaxID=370345 RepID=A0ABD0J8I8_9CAEN